MDNPIVLLHGWGGSLASLEALGKELAEVTTQKIFVLELPGFGKTEYLGESKKTEDFAKYVADFLRSVSVAKNPTLIGHSFGGKTILFGILSKIFSPSKIILINNSGIKPKNSTKKSLSKFVTNLIPAKLKNNENIKNIAYKYILKERDYLNSGKLKTTLANVVEEHIDFPENKLSDISPHIPKLIIWGEKDSYVPLWMARKQKQELQNSHLVVVPDATHALPLKQPKLVAEIISNWLNQN